MSNQNPKQDNATNKDKDKDKKKETSSFDNLASSMQSSFMGNTFLKNSPFSMGQGQFGGIGSSFQSDGGDFSATQEKPQIEFMQRKPSKPPVQETEMAGNNTQARSQEPKDYDKTSNVLDTSFSKIPEQEEIETNTKSGKPKTIAKTVDRSARQHKSKGGKDPLDLLGTKLLDKYEVTQFLGEGGMGAVYAAKHGLLGKIRAVKFLTKTENMDEISVKRFINEAKAAALVEHPNIVQVYDIEEMDEFYFIIMEFVKGSGVDEILKRKGPLPGHKAVDILIPATAGLKAIHKAKLIHRDIKPANIMITVDGEVKITDFGIVKETHAQEALTAANAVVGTPHFMAPEQINSPNIDARADIYALGSTFYYMVTRKYPFKGNTMQLFYKVMNEPPVPPHKIIPSLDKKISDIILKMMEKKPENRYQNAKEVLDALNEYKVKNKK